MTCNRLNLLGCSLTCALSLVLAVGCGDDAAEVSLELVAPQPDQVLTLKDDTDDARTGLQFGVLGQATGIKHGTSINLSIDDEPRAEPVEVADGGVIDFGDVTLPPGEHSISIATANGSVSSDKEQQYTFKALLIRKPADNAHLSSQDDEDKTKAGVQVSAEVETFAIGDGEVELVVDGTATKPEKPSSDNKVVFGPLDLSNGHHRMVARSGSGEDRVTSPEIEVEVQEGECGSVTFSMPTVPKAGEDLHLGGAGNCPSGTDPFTVTVELATDASNGSSVELFVNDRSAGKEDVANGKVRFQDVELTRRGDIANVLEVAVEGSDGASCRVEYPAKLFVDCEGPSCGIASPTPVAYDDGGETTLYLNAGMQRGAGFDIAVESDSSIVGRDVELVIDGDTQGALSASAAAEGAGTLALFDAVELAEGEHTVEGFCTDAEGNRVSTGEQTWVVDTTACGLDLTDPTEGAVIVEGDDQDAASPGTQVIASSDVTGDDCVMQRAAVCDPADGIAGVELAAYDGTSPLLSVIRLDDAASDQDLCVEVQDRAGNSALESVGVQFQTGTLEPSVTLTAPDDDQDFGPRATVGESCDTGDATEYGVLVTGTIDMGGDSEVDVLVNGSVVANDVVVTSTDVSVCVPVPDDADHGDAASTITLRATSTTSDAEDEASVDVHVHSVRITDPADGADLLLGDDCDSGAGYGYEVHADVDVTLDGATLSFDGGSTPFTDTVNGASISGCVALIEGERTITASITGSTATDSVAVTVPTLATISLDSPLAAESFGPRSVIDDTCVTGNPNEYGVPVTATVDQATDRRVDFLVNNVVVASDVPITGVTATACVAVPPDADNVPTGGSLITAQVTQTVSNVTASDSATINVNTVAITDPEQGDSLTTNCAQLPGRGYSVVVSIDPMHEGATYTFASATGNVTGTVSSNGSALGCVPLAVGAATISASLSDSADGDSVDVDVPALIDPPSVMLDSPSNGQAFDPRSAVGDTCDTGVAGEYGVPVMATIDKIMDREVSILVNDVEVVAPFTPVSTTINDCVAVPDDNDHGTPGPSTVTVVARSTVSDELGEGAALVDVHNVLITAPTENQVIADADDCDAGPGTGVLVEADVDVTQNGLGYELESNGHTLTGSVAAGAVSGCLTLDGGPQTITITIDGGPISDSAHVTGGFGPTFPIVIDDLLAPDPDDTGYRSAPVTAKWPQPTENYVGQLLAYELRCDDSPVATNDSLITKSDWWDAAQVVALPPALTPDDANPSADLDFRIGDLRHCVLRASDSSNQYTPIDQSTELTKLFRQEELSAPTDGLYIGAAVGAIGDVDGDGIDDLLVGGYGGAELYFGTSSGFAGPDLTFEGVSSGVGNSVVGLGDFNGDGMNDFAIADPEWNSYVGRINVFFGRPRGQWPTGALDLETTCNADLCLEDEIDPMNGSLLGYGLAAIGDFDGDDANDLAIGVPYWPAVSSEGEAFVVRGDDYETHACGSDTDCRAIEHCDVDTCALDVGQTFWQLEYEIPTGEWQNPPIGGPVVALSGFAIPTPSTTEGLFGWAIVGVNDFDGFMGTPAHARADFVISAPGAGEVHFISGRPHSGNPGMDVIGASEVGLRDTVSGIPSGMPMLTGSVPDSYGYAIGALGDFYDPPTGTNPGALDLAISGSITDDMFIAGGEVTGPNDPGFSTPEVHVIYQGANIGQYFANSVHPALGVLGDLDGDGQPELCAGSRTIHQINVFYADQIAADAAADITMHDGLDITGATGTSADLAPQFVGDLNDDGFSDIVVGDSYANTDGGRVVLLY